MFIRTAKMNEKARFVQYDTDRLWGRLAPVLAGRSGHKTVGFEIRSF